MVRILPVVLCCLLPAACQSGRPTVVDADPDVRGALFAPLAALEGRWEGDGSAAEFRVSSGGSAVREIMFPGTEHEMTNMYTLDGNSVLMTHYCAGGNQPHMRASEFTGDTLVFRSDGVSDLKAADEVYMGEMTLKILGPDRIEQHWRAYQGAALEQEMVFELTRVDDAGTR